MSVAVAIYGAGGLGREILQLLREAEISCAGFIADPQFSAPERIEDIGVHREIHSLAKRKSVSFVIAIGNPIDRARITRQLIPEIGQRFATVVHPAALVGRTVTIGEGSMILGMVSMTSDIIIGRHVLINPGTTIAHDCRVEDFATLGPSCALAGDVVLEIGAELGIGVSIAPRIRVGAGAMVGAGAVCIRDVLADTTVVGVPASPINRPRHRRAEEKGNK